jgi:hypothetical protein
VSEVLSHPLLTFRRLVEELPRWTYSFAAERQLHDGIARVLDVCTIRYDREVIDGANRYDFLCAGGIAIEAKINGTFMAALRQAERYCKSDRVTAVILVAARSWATGMHGELSFHGKPVRVARIAGGAFR